MGASSDEGVLRGRQVRVLETLAERLSRGDGLLPADLMALLTEELELRVDVEAIAAAWAEQGDDDPDAWRGGSARVSRRSRGRDVRDVLILKRAAKDLEALDPREREDVALEIDALAFDPLPRGVLALHGRRDDHVELRIGPRRLLYRVHGMFVIVVAITV